MIHLEYPKYNFTIQLQAGKEMIFDPIRKKYVRLTPEEWVRQNLLQYLMQMKQYPGSMMAIEKALSVNGVNRRFDIVVYQQEQPWLLIECKEPNQALNALVAQQMLSYKSVLPSVNYLCISNGNDTLLWQIHQGNVEELNAFPVWI
ncbi:MAG TPA: restriction endonuclease subunit R [Chitinophagaceae bacterium]|nr:restriction endonuclease subunit R [Chitinophagaceae bacterium]